MPDTHYYNENVTYKIKGTEDIWLSVISGNGQGGAVMITKNATFLGANEPVNAGKPEDCRNQSFRVVAVIQDKLTETNWTGVIVVVTQGARKELFSFANELPAHLDLACYVVELKMT